MIDFQRGAKTTGSKFYFNVGDTAWEEWQLITRMIEYHRKNGYEFILPPYMVKPEVLRWQGATDFAGDYYETTDGHVLIPTAETAMVGFHADEIFREEELPKKYVAFSPCFRKEAGAAGQRDKGIKRVHQFHKVELFVVCRPDQSEQLHQDMIEQVINLLHGISDELDNPFMVRAVELTEKDRAPWSNKTVDLELRPPVQGPFGTEEWLEVSSISNTGDNQSKNALIRYKPKDGGKPIKCHLLNGSGVALPRLMIAMGLA